MSLNKEIKVFGIGLNKTGTTSLGKALKILEFNNHISFNLELTKNWFNGNINSIIETAKNYNNFEDWPWPLIYKELSVEFPNSKFILTTRKNPESWYYSLCKHSLRTGPTEFRKMVYGHEMPQNYKDEHTSYYVNHNKEVRDFFKFQNERFLEICFEKGDGWEKLCHFLNKEIPKTDFPHLNKSI